MIVTERERGRDTGRGRRLHAPGARCGIRSRVSRIAPWAKGRRQTAAPPRNPVWLLLNMTLCIGFEKPYLNEWGQNASLTCASKKYEIKEKNWRVKSEDCSEETSLWLWAGLLGCVRGCGVAEMGKGHSLYISPTHQHSGALWSTGLESRVEMSCLAQTPVISHEMTFTWNHAMFLTWLSAQMSPRMKYLWRKGLCLLC